MIEALDPRRNAFRPDVADARLRGKVEAERFVVGVPARVKIPLLPLTERPGADFPMTTQALMGEDVLVFAGANDWAWVQLVRDGYVGYVRRAALTEDLTPLSHQVTALCGLTFEKPNIKSQQGWYLPLGARLSGTIAGAFLAAPGNGYVPLQHVAGLDHLASDFVSAAERLLGAPYLWGGKTSFGIDCSGLVQTAMHAAGFEAQRDSDMQAVEIGEPLPQADWPTLRRGDLVFWRGHVGIMTDGTRLLHANAHHMCVTLELLSVVVARAESALSHIIGVRRPGKLSTAQL